MFIFQDLLDEHAQGLVIRILNKVLLAFEYMTENLGQEHILPALSVVGTIAFILGAGYLMSYLVRVEEENIQKKQSKSPENKNGTFGLIKVVTEVNLKLLNLSRKSSKLRSGVASSRTSGGKVQRPGSAVKTRLPDDRPADGHAISQQTDSGLPQSGVALPEVRRSSSIT